MNRELFFASHPEMFACWGANILLLWVAVCPSFVTETFDNFGRILWYLWLLVFIVVCNGFFTLTCRFDVFWHCLLREVQLHIVLNPYWSTNKNKSILKIISFVHENLVDKWLGNVHHYWKSLFYVKYNYQFWQNLFVVNNWSDTNNRKCYIDFVYAWTREAWTDFHCSRLVTFHKTDLEFGF